MSFGRNATDWEARINFARMRKERLEKARKSAKRHGLGTILLLQEHNIRYVARGTAKGASTGAGGFRYTLLPERSEPILYEFGPYYAYVKSNFASLDVKPAIAVANQGPPQAQRLQLTKFAKQIKWEMSKHGKGKEIALDTAHQGIIHALEEHGLEVTADAGQALDEARTIKTGDELECLRVGAAISEGAFSRLAKELRAGVTETELRSHVMAEMYRNGIEFVPTAEITSGPRTGGGNYMVTTDRIVRPKDLVVVSTCMSSYAGYRICYYRTFSCGHPTEESRDAHKVARDNLYSVLDGIKPGVTTHELAEKFPKAKEFGFPDEDTAIWMQWGHGIGLVIPENPTITHVWSHRFPEKLVEGMTIAVETWMPTKTRSPGYPLGQSIRLEEMVHVTGGGCEIISKWPIDELSESTL